MQSSPVAIRLLKQVNRKVKGVTYYKWRIGEFPADVIESLGWEPGAELEAEVRDGRLILASKK